MNYTTESQIKQVGDSRNIGIQEKLLVPSGLFGFHNTETPDTWNAMRRFFGRTNCSLL